MSELHHGLGQRYTTGWVRGTRQAGSEVHHELGQRYKTGWVRGTRQAGSEVHHRLGERYETGWVPQTTGQGTSALHTGVNAEPRYLAALKRNCTNSRQTGAGLLKQKFTDYECKNLFPLRRPPVRAVMRIYLFVLGVCLFVCLFVYH